jgi:hypothetical protein
MDVNCLMGESKKSVLYKIFWSRAERYGDIAESFISAHLRTIKFKNPPLKPKLSGLYKVFFVGGCELFDG